ncbi:hypothetical protein V1524DRAFT_163792 [Lipomyces starkeyi]
MMKFLAGTILGGTLGLNYGKLYSTFNCRDETFRTIWGNLSTWSYLWPIAVNFSAVVLYPRSFS